MFRPSRERSDREDPLVVWKVRIFALGAALALAGIALDNPWTVWAGIAVLGVGLALRFTARRDSSGD